jgi:LacI family transcriptional regulator, fructose operon transcriptional repressor
MVRIKDVAIEAGVSSATVSRVLSNKPYITPGVHDRVMAAVKKLGYRPNQVARSLRSQQSTIIGLIVSDICSPFFTAVSRAVEDCAYEQGYSVFLCNTDGDEKKELKYLHDMYDKNVAGVIMSPTKKTCDNFSKRTVNIPMVVYDRTVRGNEVDNITIDNLDASYHLTKHLIANGYQRIAGIFCNEITGFQRREGFEKAIKETNLEQFQSVVIETKMSTGYDATIKLLNLNPRPDAILATDNIVLEGALHAIIELGLKIPDEVGLAGFDDVSWMTLVQPLITVVRQPTDEIGRMAVDLIMRRIEDPTRSPIQVILKSQIVIRGSSNPQKNPG